MSRKIKFNSYNKGKGKNKKENRSKSDGWFGWHSKTSWWSFKEEKQEMVAPYVGSYDSSNIFSTIKKHQEKLIGAIWQKVSANPINPITLDRFRERVWDKITPKHLVTDIYNLYYTKSVDQEYAIVDDTNSGKWKILEAVNDSSLKIITNQSSLNSVIFANEIVGAIIRSVFNSLDNNEVSAFGECMDNVKAEQAEKEEDEDNDNTGEGNGGGDDKERENSQSDSRSPESQDSESSDSSDGNDGESKNKDAEGGPQQGQGSNGENSGEGKEDGQSEDRGQQSNSQSQGNNGASKFDQLVNKVINQDFERTLSSAKEEAFKKISDLEKSGISTREIEKYASSAIKIMDQLDGLKWNAKQIADRAPNIKNILEDVIDKGTSYFSRKYEVEDVSIFESDTIDDLSGIEYFHPILKRMFIEDVTTSNYEYKGKLNVYIDVSSSMNEHCEFGGTIVDKIIFAKSLVLRMMELNMVDKVIPFGTYVRAPVEPLNIVNILLLDAHDGTSIDRVIKDCEELQENGIIVTDCQDNLFEYSTKCFILGTPDARFHLRGKAEQFKDNKQLWAFNSKGTELIAY